MKKIVVLYHSDCPDGFGAAWAAWRRFGNKADYLPIKHQIPPPRGLKNKEIYLLDITYAGKELEKLLKDNTVTTIDHHLSVKKEVERAHQFYFSNNNSGSVLTWQFFHGKKPIPLLLRYIEDRDLWKFKLPYSRTLLAAVDLVDFNFRKWDKLAADFEKTGVRKKILEEGKAIVKYQEKSARDLIKKADLAIFQGRRVWVVNTYLLKNEVAHALVRKGPPVALVWNRQGDEIRVSLRSSGGVDVAKMAQKYRGGGHKASAGFAYDAKRPLPWKYVKMKE